MFTLKYFYIKFKTPLMFKIKTGLMNMPGGQKLYICTLKIVLSQSTV